MKNLLLAASVLCSPVQAQVIECPRHIPPNEVALSEASSSHQGSARLLPTGLSFAGIQASKLYGLPVEVPPASMKVKGGWETRYRFASGEMKWLVCLYGGDGKGFSGGALTENVEWWGKVDAETTSCVLKVREIRKEHAPTSYAATATCT